MLQFIIQDFQSISKANIEPHGLTLIVGESNQGKSAILRAVKAAAENHFRPGQVKTGHQFAQVHFKDTDTGDVLSVRRSYQGGSPLYRLNDLEFSKLGRSLPQEVLDFLSLSEVDVAGESVSVNFHTQFQKPLLLDKSQQKIMELLSTSSSMEDLKKAKQLVNEQRLQLQGSLKSLSQRHIEALKALEQAHLRADEVSKLESVLNPLIDQSLSEVDKYTKILTLKKSLLESNKVSLQKSYASLNQTLRILHLVSSGIIYLSSYKKQLESLHLLESYLKTYSTFNQKSLTISTLRSLYGQRSSIHSRLSSLKHKQQLINSYGDLQSELSDYKTILDNISLYTLTKDMYDSTQSRIEECKKIMDGICPTCGTHLHDTTENK